MMSVFIIVIYMLFSYIVFGMLLYSFIKEIIKTFEKVNTIKKVYNESSYCRVTNKTFKEVFRNKGSFGEFLTYYELMSYEENGNKFLFNLYIPLKNENTTEIDLIMITKKGLLVFESKNYSGWIFGSDKSKYWMQTLPSRKGKCYKTQFYSPILQNKGHINNLRRILQSYIPCFSIIVFSDRCTFKKIPESTNETKVIHRNNISNVVRTICNTNKDVINEEKIEVIYNKLYGYTQVSDDVKREHIYNIRNNR